MTVVRSTLFSLSMLALSLGVYTPSLSAQDLERDAAIAGIPKGWLIAMRRQAAAYVDHAGASFTLDEGELGLLTRELDRRISDQWQAETDLFQNGPVPPADNSEEEATRFAKEIDQAYQTMPMNKVLVLRWLVETLAEPDEIDEGSSRFMELCYRYDRLNETRTSNAEEKVGLGQLLRGSRERRVFLETSGLITLAANKYIDADLLGIEARVNDDGENEQWRSKGPTLELPPPLPPALQFQDWLEAKTNVPRALSAEMYSLFEQLNFRTWRVVASKGELYGDLIQVTSNNETELLIIQAGLKPPMLAILHEFQCRISNEIAE